MYFGYNQQSQFPHSISIPSQSINVSQINRSLLLEPKVVTLQRESENYIRLVEQEKKHYYNVDETWLIVKKEWTEKRARLEEIQKIKQSPEQKLQHSKIKNLQNALEQAISKYNETQATNLQLQQQINLQRKDRVSKDSEQLFLNEIQDESLKKMEKSKEQIAELKKKNDTEKDVYVSQFDKLSKEVQDEKRQRDVNKLQGRKEKIESIDTGTLMKQRLKRIIANNKEKVKVIEHYLKNMRVIDEAFTQIQEASQISDIEEIQNTFIKSEEQNYSLYNYVDILSQEIDTLSQANEDLKQKIGQQEIQNQLRLERQKATPEVQKIRRKNDQITMKRTQEIEQLRIEMDKIGPDLQSILIDLSKTKLAQQPGKQFDYELSFNLNESSMEGYLQELEYFINLLIAKQLMQQHESVINSTLLLDQIPVKDFNVNHLGQIHIQKEEGEQDRFLDKNGLKILALDYIDKKKKI